MSRDAGPEARPPGKEDFERLAAFRSELRRYLLFSDGTVREHGLTPQQYELLLVVKGSPGREWVTVGEVAEQLGRRHHSASELVDRAQRRGLVDRMPHPGDARAVRVVLTGAGEAVLAALGRAHLTRLAELDRAGWIVPFGSMR